MQKKYDEEVPAHLRVLTANSNKKGMYKIEISKNNLPVPSVKKEKGWLSLHSLYDPSKEKPITAQGCPVVLGMGGLYHLDEIIRSEQPFILIEPRADLFEFLLEKFDLSGLLKKRNCLIITGEISRSQLEQINKFYSPYRHGLLQFEQHRRSASIWPDEHRNWAKAIITLISQWSTELATQSSMSNHWYRNILINSNEKEESPPLKSLKKRTILLGAGPYVEEKISQITQLMQQCSIVSTDSVLPLLLSNNIKPDLILSMDSQWASGLHYYGLQLKNLTLLADMGINRNILSKFKTKILCINQHPLIQYLGYKGHSFETYLGNISAAVLPVLYSLGVQDLCIWGADYSFPRGKSYCNESYIWKHYMYKSNRITSLTHGNYSFSTNNATQTNSDNFSTSKMKHYRKSLEQFLKDSSFIDSYSYSNKEWKISFCDTNQENRAADINQSSQRLKRYKEKLNALSELEESELLAGNFPAEWVTLFPLCARHLLNKDSPRMSLEKAKKYAIAQVNALLS